MKLIMVEPLKNVKKRGRQAFDRPFELRLGLYFQQGFHGGWDYGLVQTGQIPDRIDRADI